MRLLLEVACDEQGARGEAMTELVDELAGLFRLPAEGLQRLQIVVERGSEGRLELSYGSPLQDESVRAVVYHLKERTRPEAAVVVCEWGTVDPESGLAYHRNGAPMHLSPKERQLLTALARRPNRFSSKDYLLSQTWGPGFGGEGHYLRVLVGQLRRRLGDYDPFKFIERHTGGYVLRAVSHG